MPLSFKTSKGDQKKIDVIVSRVVNRWPDVDAMTVSLDLTACHCNGNPLNLDRLLSADDFNLAHDVFGINEHIDHDTGELHGNFSPRCSW